MSTVNVVCKRLLSIFILIVIILTSRYVFAEVNNFTAAERNLLKGIKTIRLDIETSSYKPEPYNIGRAIKRKLQLEGFDVISEAQNNYDAKIYVRYNEKTCGQYSPYGLGKSGEPGTCIECFILMLHDKLGTIFKADISSRTPYSVEGHDTLYGAAIREFENVFEFKYLGVSVAVALSMPADTSGLVEGLISLLASDRKKALQLLERAGWVPKTPDQKAMVAIASANWNDCISIGQPAVEPLSKILKTRDRAKAAWALGEIGDKQAVNPLIETLKHEYVDDTEVKLQVIIALGKLKDNLALERLQTFLKHDNKKVAEAAKEAIENIRSQK